jgi:hypothetical protein
MKLSRIAIALVTFLACSILHTAESADLTATVPFDFWLGQSVMPAGEYRIIQRPNGMVTVREGGRRYAARTFFTNPVNRHEKPMASSLEFNRYGDTYFLSKIWAPNSHDGRTFPTSRHEKELASRASPAKTAAVALLTK